MLLKKTYIYIIDNMVISSDSNEQNSDEKTQLVKIQMEKIF